MQIQARLKERRRRGESCGGRMEEASPPESKHYSRGRSEWKQEQLDQGLLGRGESRTHNWRGGRGERWWQKKAVRETFWTSTRRLSTPDPRQWPGHCQGLALSYQGCVSKRHSGERLRKGEKSRRGSVSELSLCTGPRARQFTDSISFNHHNNPARKESRLPVSSEEMEAQSKTIFLS